jgi:hypothetical protein
LPVNPVAQHERPVAQSVSREHIAPVAGLAGAVSVAVAVAVVVAVELGVGLSGVMTTLSAGAVVDDSCWHADVATAHVVNTAA